MNLSCSQLSDDASGDLPVDLDWITYYCQLNNPIVTLHLALTVCNAGIRRLLAYI